MSARNFRTPYKTVPGMSDGGKKNALARFFEPDRRGLIEHDGSTANETGQCKVRTKLEAMKFPSNSTH
jgi:hypothetical protein